MNPNTIIVPSTLKGIPGPTLDLRVVNIAEARIPEVAIVTPEKAPELLAAFNVAYLEASRMAIQLEEELLRAKQTVERVKALIILDRAPKILTERGLSTGKNPAGSADLRQAVIDSDPEYQQAVDIVNAIDCYMALMKNKAKGIEMAYTSVKRILGENAFNYAGKLANLNLSAGELADDVEAGQTIETRTLPTSISSTTHTGFGKSRYR